MITKEFITVKLDELHPYENNPRINDSAVSHVKASIEQCENLDPIEIDENGVILSGHTRLLALQELGYTETEVVRISGLDEDQKRKYRILANKTNEIADWDFNKLAEELDGLDFDGFDFGFDSLERLEIQENENQKITEDDYEEELPEEPKAKRGDIYQLGRHRLMCGDSTSVEDIKKLVDGAVIDLWITDPPYNVEYVGKTKDALTIQNDSMDDSSFRQFLRDAYTAADAVMKPGAVFYIWHADSDGYNFRGACKDVDWQVRECLIWAKNCMVLGRQDYQWQHEPCLYGWKSGASHFWNSDRKQTTLLEFKKPARADIHPTMKPIALFDYQIKNSSKPGENVLDSFNGSGTTIMACEQNGRNAFAVEIDPRYVDATINRWEQFTGQKAVKLN